MRAILLRHRSALINQLRGLLGGRGLAFSRSPEAFMRAMPELLRTSADKLTSFCQTFLTELLQHLRAIEERVHLIEALANRNARIILALLSSDGTYMPRSAAA